MIQDQLSGEKEISETQHNQEDNRATHNNQQGNNTTSLNMAQPQQVTIDPIKYLSNLPNFNGNMNDLHTFTELIDRIFPLLSKYDNLSQLIFFDIIKSRLTGKAREVVEINNNITSWQEMKKIFYHSFGDRLSIEQLYDELRFLTFKTNCFEFYNEIKAMLRRLNNKSKIENKDENEIKNNSKTALRIFINKIPDPMKSILCCRNPNDLEEAIQILHETGYAFTRVNSGISRHVNNVNKNNASKNTHNTTYKNSNNTNNTSNRNTKHGENNNNKKYHVNNDNKSYNYRRYQQSGTFRNNYYNPNNHHNANSYNPNRNQYNQNYTTDNNRDNIEPMDVDETTINRRTYNIQESQNFTNENFRARSLNNPSLPYIIINTPVRKLRFIIDTGATSSIVNPGVCNPKWQIPVSKPIELITINQRVKIPKKVKIPIFKEFNRKDEYVEFLEYSFHSEFDGLIGNNILKPLNVEINYKNKELITEHSKLKLYFDRVEEEYEVFLNSLENIYSNVDLQKSCSPLEQIRLEHLNKEEKEKIIKVIKEFSPIFFQEGTNLSFTHAIKHEIKTKNEIPIYSKSYRYPEVHKSEVKNQITEMLEQGIIRPSNSPYSSPIWVVPKKLDASGKQKWRIVIDYRKLNEVTIDDKFPIPIIEEIFDKLGRAQYFTTLDLAKGFHQVEIEEKDIKKTAFSTNEGHFEFTRMPFGLKNAPATFQRLMNSVLSEYLGKICWVYLDDIIIFSTSLDEHIDSIRKIFARLKQVNLKVQLDKSEFLRKETEFLGHVITTEGIKPNPNKIEAILKYQIPRTTKQIKSFLGITGYYRKFIKDYSKIAKPMTKFLKKGSKININDPDYIKSFEDLKKLLTSEPILKYPDFEKKFVLTTDASNYALGAVLSQEGHPVCFASRTLNDHEVNYSTIEKELLAIVWAVKYFRPYLYGRKFCIQTDHRPLVWLNSLKEPNNKLQRWKVKLGEYNFDIEYVKGKNNNVADGLSRIEVHSNEIEVNEENDDNLSTRATIHSAREDNTDYIPIVNSPLNIYKTQIVINKTDRTLTHKYSRPFGKKRLLIELKEFNEVSVVDLLKKYMPSKGIVAIYSNDDHMFAQFQDTYLKYFSNNKLIKVIKTCKFLQDIEDEERVIEIIDRKHKEFNHRGINETYKELKDLYYVPHLKDKISKILNNCDICNTAKFERNPYKPLYKITETPKSPNEILHIDVWLANRQTMYLTVIDKFTKHVTMHKLRSRSWIDLLDAMKTRVAIMGIPKKIVMDGEAGFKVNALKQYFSENGIEVHTTTAQRHTGNSDIERFHATLNEHIRILKAKDKNLSNNDLDNSVLLALSIYNRTIHSTTGKRPIDFVNGEIKQEDYKEIIEKVQKQKEKYIEKLNKNRENLDLSNKDHSYVKSRNVISNTFKLYPRYKKIGRKTVVDTDYYQDEKGIKYYKDQLKRKYKHEINSVTGNDTDGDDNNTDDRSKQSSNNRSSELK